MTFYKTPILETERLILRPTRIDDAIELQQLFNDWNVVKDLAAAAIEWPIADDNFHRYLEDDLLPKMAAGTDLGWVLALRGDGTIMGSLCITPDDQEDTRGFWLGSVHHRYGYMTEAVVATTDYFFDYLKMGKMILNNAAINTASRRIKEKANAEFIGVTPDHAYVGGTFPQEQWLLTPARWRDSPMKRTAASPSYRIIG